MPQSWSAGHLRNSASLLRARGTNLLWLSSFLPPAFPDMRLSLEAANLRAVRASVLGALLLAASASCGNPRAEAAIAQELNDAAGEISAVKGDIAQLQNDVDSLRQVIAKQDTVISRLVEVTHVPR